MTKNIPNGSAMSVAIETAVQSSRNINMQNLSNVSNYHEVNINNNGKENDNQKAAAGLIVATVADLMSTDHDQNLRKSAKDMIDAVIATSITKLSSKGLTQDVSSKEFSENIPIPIQVVTTEEGGATTLASPRGD